MGRAAGSPPRARHDRPHLRPLAPRAGRSLRPRRTRQPRRRDGRRRRGLRRCVRGRPAGPDRLLTRFRELAEPLVADGADVVIPAGALLALLLRNERGLTVGHAPVVNCVAVTLKATEAWVKLRSSTGLGPSRGPSFALAPPGAVADFRAFVARGRRPELSRAGRGTPRSRRRTAREAGLQRHHPVLDDGDRCMWNRLADRVEPRVRMGSSVAPMRRTGQRKSGRRSSAA